LLKRRTFIKFISSFAGGALLGGIAYGYQSNRIEIHREKIICPAIAHRLRIVAVSDIHAPQFPGSDGTLVDLINSQKPDICIFAGDIIDQANNETLVREFHAIQSSLTKIAVLGNWEYLSKLNLQKLRREYHKAGIRLLINESFRIGPLCIFGADDLVEGSFDCKIIQHTPRDESPLTLLVSHCPAIMDDLNHDFPFLIISGHTHGGQIAPFGLALITPPGSGDYVRGWYHKGNTAMYVMKGIGTTPGMPLRIGCKPEIFVLDLENFAN
jgi:predicted MPP superfamily phosphohydrolase